MKTILVVAFIGISLIGSLRGAAIEPVTELTNQSTAGPEVQLDINEDCHQPRETGRCYALFYRYAYNVESQKCEEFIYGGCAGNKNNFQSQKECEQKCLSKSDASVVETTTVTSESTTNVSADVN